MTERELERQKFTTVEEGFVKWCNLNGVDSSTYEEDWGVWWDCYLAWFNK